MMAVSRQQKLDKEGLDAKAILCNLNTTIAAKPGHPVILGMTPVDSKASIFVVQILE